jgi:hypothetical protein
MSGRSCPSTAARPLARQRAGALLLPVSRLDEFCQNGPFDSLSAAAATELRVYA